MKTNRIKLRQLILAVLLVLSVFGNGLAQKKKFKDYLLSGSASFVSGMLDGTIETISFHYESGFLVKFPKVNHQYWNPAISWRNKYKNNNPAMGPKYWGSTTFFAWNTDAYHLLRTSKRLIDGFNVVYYMNETCALKIPNKKKWRGMAKDFIILTAIRSAGFQLTYTFIFAPQKP